MITLVLKVHYDHLTLSKKKKKVLDGEKTILKELLAVKS